MAFKLISVALICCSMIAICNAEFYILGLFTLTRCEEDYTCSNAKLNEKRMRVEHYHYESTNDVKILCTRDVKNDHAVLYTILLDIVLGGKEYDVTNTCIDQTQTGVMYVDRLIVFTYLEFRLTQIASSILLPLNITLIGITNQPMYPAFYLEHPLSYYSYQASFGEKIHKTLFKRFFTKHGVNRLAILNLEDDSTKPYDGSCQNENMTSSVAASAFCLYSEEFQDGCYKERHLDSADKTDVLSAVQLLNSQNFSFVVLSGQSHKIQKFAIKSGIQLYLGSPFYLGYVKTVRENFTAATGRGYAYSDVLVNFPGDFPINQFLNYVYYATFTLLHDALVWSAIIENYQVKQLLRGYSLQYHQIISGYNPGYKKGDPLTFNIWQKIPHLIRKPILKEMIKRKELLTALLEEGKNRSYVDKVKLDDLKTQNYFNPELAYNATQDCSLNKPTCPKGYELLHSYYTEINWDQSYGWNCRQCLEGFYKNEIGNLPCKSCLYPLRTDESHTKCFDPYQPVFIEVNEPFSIFWIAVSTFLTVAIVSAICIFFIKRNTPIVLSSNWTMTCIQLFFHIVLAISSVALFIGKPTKWSCISRPILIGVSFCTLVAVNLSKTQKVLMIFQSRVKLIGRERFITNAVEWFIIVLVLVVDLILLVVTFTSAYTNADVQQTYKHAQLLKQIHCNNDSNNIFLIQLLFTLFLVLCNGIQGFTARFLPSHYKETTHVIYSSFISTIILIASTAVYLGQTDPIVKETILMLVTGLLNLTHFGLLYSYKLFVMIFKPELNTKQAFHKKRIQKIEKQFQKSKKGGSGVPDSVNV